MRDYKGDSNGRIMIPSPVGEVDLLKLTNRIYSVENFGAVGDGVNDDTVALIKARDHIKSKGGVFYIPEGMNCKVTGSLDLFGLKNIRVDGKITGDNVGSELIIGFSSAQTTPVSYLLNDVAVMKVKIQGLKNADIKINRADHVLLWADGDISTITSIAYCRFNIGKATTLEFDSQGSEIGWINENLFFGGRFTNIIMDGNYSHNHNKFYSPSLETCTINIINGSNNQWYDVRFEGTQTITFGESTYDNVIERSWYSSPGAFLRGTASTTYTDSGRNNVVANSLESLFTRRIMFEINCESQNFALSDITRNEKDLSATAWKTLYESDLIEVTEDFGITVKGDASIFRHALTCYDENGVQITGVDPEAIETSSMVWDGSYYVGGSNASNMGVGVYKKTGIKYIKYKVTTGASGTFKFLSAVLKSLKRPFVDLNIPVLNKHKRWSHTAIPTAGYWEIGDIVWNSDPAGSEYIGWVCITTGTFGTGTLPVFKGFGSIQA